MFTIPMKKIIPQFKNEDEERKFWTKHSPLDYLDWSSAQQVTFSNLKPSLKSISIRLPTHMLDTLKVLANKQDVPYQSLVKIFLSRQIQNENSRMQRSEKRVKIKQRRSA